jgi:hypothetical protein
MNVTLPAAPSAAESVSRTVFAPNRHRVAVLAAALATVAFAALSPPARAATPAGATISESTPRVTWTGPLMPATAGGCAGANDASCDNFELTVAPPSPAFGPYVVEVRLQPVGDWDLQAYDPADRFLKGSGAGPNVGEIVQLYNPAAGTYTIAAAAFAPLAGPDVDGDLIPDSYSASAELLHQPASPAAAAASEALGFSNHAWPGGTGANCGDGGSGFCGGEPSIGVNGSTGKVMYAAGVPLQTLRVSFDAANPPQATWQNVSHVWTQTPRAFADPLLFTDRQTGRTFALQLEGLTPFSTMAFTDDDGASWTPSQGSGVASGIDHQTVGGGPFAPPLTRDPGGAQYPNAVYYCAQELVAANCARSDDGGLTFGPAVTIYTTECGGLHGHVKVAPDGTVYVPNKGCSGGQGIVVSEDNGLTWAVRKVPGSGTGDSDPSVAIAGDGTVYFAFQDGDGHPKVAVSHDKGVHWDTYGAAHAAFQDVGAPFGIRNTAFPEMVAGDPLRAAYAFLGTTTGGGMQDASFAGVWHLFVASTYDGGATWTTVDATPTDPVQRGCIWLGGGSNVCRNLLDFNDAAVDEQGRVLVAYADGCTGACVANAAANTHSAGATIARQSAGRRMLAAFDADLRLPTATALLSSPNPSTAGQSVTFTATVTAASGTPTGAVAFREGATTLGSASVDGSGIATFTTSALGAGSHAVVASYGGDATFAASASPPLSQVVAAAPAVAGPRFDVFMSPPGVADDWGEPSIGINWQSERSFSNSGGPIPNGGTLMSYGGINVPTAFRVTANDCPSPARALWEPTAQLVLAGATRAAGDPILWTDRDTGRTIVSQLLGGTWTSTAEITDDDGRSFTPSQGSGIVSGIDHQTIGGGPFHAPLSSPLYRNAVYYCSQDVADAVCSLSVDGGRTFGPAVPIFTRADCNGLHGHVKVGPDGTAYVPDKGCGGSDPTFHADGHQAVVVSENNGLTWEVRLVTTSTVVAQSLTGVSTQAWDPSVAIAGDGSVYFGYQAADGHPHVAVSFDKGRNWSRDSDVGAALGIQNTSFPTMVAGDPLRAAFAFFGTTTGGTDYDQPTFAGVWHLYVAATYDGGQSWSIANVTPGDPIQRGGICGGGDCRNLLDFFDAGVDRQGRIVVGYDDGCVTAACIGGGQDAQNDFTAKGAIARQSGGPRMFAAYDPLEPGLPKAPNVTAALGAGGTSVQLAWTTPDGSGAAVSSYTVYRGVAGSFQPIAALAANGYEDTGVVPGVAYAYRVTASNVVGEGPYCGEASPPVMPATGAPPVAVGDAATTARDVATTIAVLANDSDPDGDPLRITALTQPASGVAVDNGDGTVSYSPNGGFAGGDGFGYTVSDGHGGTATATVSLTVSTATAAPPQFGHDTIVDFSATGGEPFIRVGPKSTPVQDQVFVSAPFGVSTTVSLLWKSIDGAQSFIPLGTPIVRDAVVGPGGGDTAQDFDAVGRFYYADLSAACVTAAVSDDGGNTFPPERNNPLVCIGGGDDVEGAQDDRQWVAAFGDGRGYVTVRNLAVAAGEGNFHLFRTRDAGLTWNGAVLGTVGQSGPLQIDKKKRKVVVGGVERDAILLYQVHTGLNVFRITDLDDGSMPTGVNRSIVSTPNVLFPVLAIDGGGNLYVVWSDGSNVYLRTSRDRGDTWSATTRVNPPALDGANIMPWIVAGDPGRIDVVWYRTAGSNGPGAAWDIYMAQSLNALGAPPAFTVRKLSETVIHRGEICLRGLSCDLPEDPLVNPEGPGDRSFLEFPSIDKDSAGMAVVTFNDNTNQAAGPGVAGGSYVMVTRQTGGASLFGGTGGVGGGGTGAPAVTVTKPLEGASVPLGATAFQGTHALGADDSRSDPAGDARFPDHGAAIGPNVPALDIRKMTLTDDASTIIVKMEIADLTPAALATAAAQSGGDGVLYLAQWDYLDRVWWVAMEVRGTVPRFYTGTLGIIKSATSKKYITYNPELGPSAQVTGVMAAGVPGTVTIYVPRYLVGPAAAGGAMFMITGYTLSERGPLLPAGGSNGDPNPSSLPLQVDAAGPFTHVVADGAAVDGTVEIAIDDASFGNPRTAAATAAGTWSVTVSGLALGPHTVYARQRGRGREATTAAPVHFTVGGP